MRLVFISNYFNHHQKPLCDALAAQTVFSFLETEEMPPQRRELGWSVVCPDYVTRDPSVLADADVVMAGSAPEKLVRSCILQGKLVFRYHERPLKAGNTAWKYLPRLVRWHWRNPHSGKVWLLCAGSKVAQDYAKFGLFQGKALKWGYFPESGPVAEAVPRSILWVGRLIDWKHPDAALRLARRLRENGMDFQMEIVGTGPMEAPLREQIHRDGLEGCVRLTGAVPVAQVRQKMATAAVCLMTSDAREGWGAVLNEAMGGGCAVVANRSAGATEYLLRSGENGFVYETEEQLTDFVRQLLEQPALAQRLGQRAAETIGQLWNAEVAARRLATFAQRLLDGQPPEFWEEGPCSRG